MSRWVSILILSYSFLFFPVGAQSTIDFEEYLRLGLRSVDSLLSQRALLSTFKPSWIEKIDVRTETDEFDVDRQQYLVRFSPSTPGIRKAQMRLAALYGEKASLDRDQFRRDFIRDCYEDWLRIHRLSNQLKLRKNLLVILLDEQTVLQKLATQPDSRPKDLIEILEDISQLQIRIHRDEGRLKGLLPPGKQADFSGLISPETIAEKLLTTPQDQLPDWQKEALLRQQLTEAEIDLEKAEQKRYLDFLQLQYRGPHTDVWEEKLSVSLAFVLPFSPSRKLKIQELEIEQDLQKQEEHIDHFRFEDRVNRKRLELQQLFAEKDFVEDFFTTSSQQANTLASRYSKNESANPLLLLYQKRSEIENQLKLEEIEAEIYRSYFELQELTGALYQQPLRNLLLAN